MLKDYLKKELNYKYWKTWEIIEKLLTRNAILPVYHDINNKTVILYQLRNMASSVPPDLRFNDLATKIWNSYE